MRWIGVLVLAVGVALLGGSCFDYVDDCTLSLTCPPGIGPDSGPPTACDPTKASGPVADSCGVFVSPAGDDGNVGSQEKPLKTLGAAVTKGSTIYACAGATPYTEAVVVQDAVTLYGALDCDGWAYDATKKTVLTASAGAIPLTLKSTAVGAEVFDFSITAADNTTTPGGSSIAVVVDQATATFTRCSMVAGRASDGTPGASGGVQAAQADGGKVGGAAGLTGAGSITGGNGGQNNVCSVAGGNGGNGGTIPNGNGQNGQPGDNGSGGPNGTGDTGAGCGGPNPNGSNGMKGSAGPVMSGIGTLSATGYQGIDGQPGTDGANGSSGGGGGGSMATTTAHGGGGGGGGAGGCGGMHGTGGTAAGSSIALVSLTASVTLMNCSLGAGTGGTGGAGGDGQLGQLGGGVGSGGTGGMGAGSACNGGKGGDAGNGGNGSGGLGGNSLGIAVTGTAPVLDAPTKVAITPGTRGSGGLGGNADADMNHGADGVAAACWDFGANGACK